MKRILFILFACIGTIAVQAQRITYNYKDVSLSDALRLLNKQQSDYTIMFLYNELEDFRVTTSVKRQTIPDAIRQMIGFYPISITVEDSNSDDKKIFVESIYKTDNHLRGTIIDEQGLPVAFANIAVLNPQDSTLITGGVSNEGGYFAIPYCLSPDPSPVGRGVAETESLNAGKYDNGKVLLRISYVGYKTVWKMCEQYEVGMIRMKPDSYSLGGVVVQGERPKVQMQGNTLVMNVEGTVMERLGTAEDVLTRVPTISKKGDGYEILGKGVPLIYLNNRKITDLNELRNVQSDYIRNVEVVQNPGARYDATVNAVIVIRTKRAEGDGLGIEINSWSRKAHGSANNERLNLTYRTGGLELFGNIFGAYNKRWNRGEFRQTTFSETQWDITNSHKEMSYNPFFEGRAGFNYQIDDNNSLGGFYQNTYDYVKTYGSNTDDLLADGMPYDRLQNSSVHRDRNVPKHQVNLYYTGKIGKWNVDFNADYTFQKQVSRNTQQELSEEYENRDVNTENITRSSLLAEKLVVTHQLWKGQVEMGEEYTNTRWRSNFENPEGYISNSNNEQHEHNIAPFLELRQQLGQFQLQAGLRYEHVESDYYVSGQRRDDQSRTYDNLYPSLSVSTSIPVGKTRGGLSLSYSKRASRPSYFLLSNDVIYENRLNQQTGNPYLKPVKYHNFNVTATWRWLYFTANYTHCVDPILFATESLESDSKVNLVTVKNYDHADWITVTLGLQKDINLCKGIAWTPQYNVSLMKPSLKAKHLDKDINFNHPMLSLQFGNILTLPHDWLFRADFNMHTHGDTGSNNRIDCTNAILSFSVSKDFFKRKLNVKLSGDDLFNGGISHGTFYFNRMKIHKMEDDDSRCITLSLRYRLNVTPSKYRGTGAGNTEKNRL